MYFLYVPHYFYFQASTIDGRRKGACLFCQEYFMDLYLLAELKTISLKVSVISICFIILWIRLLFKWINYKYNLRIRGLNIFYSIAYYGYYYR